jgi:hypothetical protein
MDNEKLKLSTAISIVVHTLAVIALFEVSRRLQEAGRQSGLAAGHGRMDFRGGTPILWGKVAAHSLENNTFSPRPSS